MINQGEFAVLALGGAGCRIISHLAGMPQAEQLKLLAMDTDQSALETTGLPPENCILAGELWRNGKGCGGNVLDGQRAASHERPRLTGALQGCKALIICGGLGGGTASGSVQIALSVASNLHLPAVCLFTLPFSQEGMRRVRTAEQVVLNDIVPVADALIALPNDLLFASLDSKTPLAEAFKQSDLQMARSILALSSVLLSGNLYNTDFSSFSGLLKRKKSRCALGVGVVEAGENIDHPAQEAVSRMLASPLLGGPSVLADADEVILTLLGGNDLSLGDTQEAFAFASGCLGKNSGVLTGAAVNPAWQGTFQFTALAVKFDEVSKVESPLSQRKGRRRKNSSPENLSGSIEQLDLPIDEVLYHKGIMEKTDPTRWGNEDLDVPTFQRKNLVVDTGKK